MTSTRINAILAALVATFACACTSPLHLGYDYGRAYTQAVTAQADLTRASVVNLQHPLAGVEAQAIRIRAQEETTDKETGQSELKAGTK